MTAPVDGIPFWFAPDGGVGRDHLIVTCPALQRESKGRPVRGRGPVGDPYDLSVCGWCRRVYRARARDAE